MPLRRPSCWAHRVGMVGANGTITTAHPDDRGGGALTRADVMTAGEVAELLGLPVSTVYHLARQGRLPACRLGRTWRFLRPRIEELLRA
jgi:excisionase family DNA binding protein